MEEVFREREEISTVGTKAVRGAPPVLSQYIVLRRESKKRKWVVGEQDGRESRVYAFVVGDKKPGIGTQAGGRESGQEDSR